MGSFHERVAAVQDGVVGQGSGRANIYIDRNFGLDVQPVGLLCCSVAMGLALTADRVVTQSTDGTALFQFIVQEDHLSGCLLQGVSLRLEELTQVLNEVFACLFRRSI